MGESIRQFRWRLKYVYDDRSFFEVTKIAVYEITMKKRYSQTGRR
jgi:hypothetical protein